MNKTIDKQEIVFDIIKYLTTNDTAVEFNELIKEDSKDLDKLHKLCEKPLRTMPEVEESDYEEIFKTLDKWLFSYYILDDLIDDESISDIKCKDENTITFKRYGKRYKSDLKFKDKQDYERFIRSVATKNKRNLSANEAIQHFSDVTTSPKFRLRFNLTTSVNVNRRPLLHIRKIPKKKYTLEDLVHASPEPMMSEEVKEILKAEYLNGKGMLIVGKGSAGKSTLMNALIEETPKDEDILCIQETDELFINDHPGFYSQAIQESMGEGTIEYTHRDLCTNGLLLDVDRIIIGETKGAEASALFQASHTGYFVMTSLHATSATQAFSKYIENIKLASDYTEESLLRMLAWDYSCIVFLKDFKVKEIAFVKGFDSEKNEVIYDIKRF